MGAPEITLSAHRRLHQRRETAWHAYLQAAAYMRQKPGDEAKRTAGLRALDKYEQADRKFKACDLALYGTGLKKSEESPQRRAAAERARDERRFGRQGRSRAGTN